MKQILLMIAVVALVGCGGAKKAREEASKTSPCVDCGGVVAPSAVSCPHCGSTDFTGSMVKAAVEAKEESTKRLRQRFVGLSTSPQANSPRRIMGR